MLAIGTRAHRAAGASTGAASAARATSACRASAAIRATGVMRATSCSLARSVRRNTRCGRRMQAWLVRMHLALHMRAILRIGVRAMPTQADEGDCWRCAARRCAQ